MNSNPGICPGSTSSIVIVGFNEHWLQKSQITYLVKMPSYKVTAFYCQKIGRKGGSSCILLKSNLNVVQRNNLCVLNKNSVFEVFCLEHP